MHKKEKHSTHHVDTQRAFQADLPEVKPCFSVLCGGIYLHETRNQREGGHSHVVTAIPILHRVNSANFPGHLYAPVMDADS